MPSTDPDKQNEPCNEEDSNWEQESTDILSRIHFKLGRHQWHGTGTTPEEGHTGLALPERIPLQADAPAHTRKRSDSTDSVVTALRVDLRSRAPAHTRERLSSTYSAVTMQHVADRGIRWDLNEDGTVAWFRDMESGVAESNEHDLKQEDEMSESDIDQSMYPWGPPPEQHYIPRRRLRLRTGSISPLDSKNNGIDDGTSLPPRSKFKMRVPRISAQHYKRSGDHQDRSGESPPDIRSAD